MADRFSDNAPTVTGPATHAFLVTPSDTTSFADATRAIYCGVAGDIAAVMLSGAVVTFTNVPAGTLLPLRTIRIAAAGTTAGGLIGLV
jgi:hypothetical protein